MKWTKALAVNLALLLFLIPSAYTTASVLFWQDWQTFTIIVDPPIESGLKYLDIDLSQYGSFYSGVTYHLDKNNASLLAEVLTTTVYVPPKKLTVQLTNPLSLVNYTLFRVDLVVYSAPSGSGWGTGQTVLSVGFGFSGATSSATVTLTTQGTYVFDLKITFTTTGLVSQSVVQPELYYSVTD